MSSDEPNFLYPAGAAAGSYIASVSSSSSSSSSSFFLPCPRSGAGSYIASVSFFFFLLSSSICQHANISDTLGPIMLILGQSNKSVNAHFWHDQFGVKGYDGVTGVKKGHFHQNCYFFYRSHGMVMWLMHTYQLVTLYKSYGRKNSCGVIWGHRGQKGHFHQSGYFSYRLHGMIMWLMHIDQLDTLYKRYRIKNSSGSLQVTGVKRSFSKKKKPLFLQQITWYGHVTHAYLSDRYPLQK